MSEACGYLKIMHTFPAKTELSILCGQQIILEPLSSLSLSLSLSLSQRHCAACGLMVFTLSQISKLE